MLVKVSNTTNQNVVACYRMPGKNDIGRPYPVIEVHIQPRALNNDIAFPSKEHFIEWEHQNRQLFDNGVLIKGTISENQAIVTSKEVADKNLKAAKETSDKVVDKIAEAADSVNAKVTITDEPVAKKSYYQKQKERR